MFKKKNRFPSPPSAFFCCCSFFSFSFFFPFFWGGGFSPFLVLFDYFSVSRDFLRQPFPQRLVVLFRPGGGGKRGKAGATGVGDAMPVVLGAVLGARGGAHAGGDGGLGDIPISWTSHGGFSLSPPFGCLLGRRTFGISLLISLGTTGAFVLFLLLASAVVGVPLL